MPQSQRFRFGSVVQSIAVRVDAKGRHYSHLRDITDTFPGATRFEIDGTILVFLEDDNGERYEPRRLAHCPDDIIDIVPSTPVYAPLTPPTSAGDRSEVWHSRSRAPSRTASLESSEADSLSSFSPMSIQPASPPLSRRATFDVGATSSSNHQLASRPTVAMSTISSEITRLQNQLGRATDRQCDHHVVLMEQLLQMVQRQQDMMREQQVESRERDSRMLQEFAGAKERDEQMQRSQQQTIDRLVILQQRVDAILVQNYELHEYPIPRLFVILPESYEDRDPRKMLHEKFRLYFLCECGDHCRADSELRATKHTMNVSSSVSVFNPVQTKAQIHLASHEGYELSRPSEFFDRYGPYVLGILKILRHCLAVAALVSPGIGQLQDTVDIALNKAEYIAKNTMDAVDMSINFLQQKLEDHAFAESFLTQESDDQRGDPSFKNLTALEGADLRRLDTFLRNKDKDKVLGNLYRITTSEGHVKWVCLEHYRASYRETAMASFLQLVQVNQGVYDAQLRKVTINLSSRTVATEFFRKIAGQASALNEIDMTINWSFRSADLVTIVTALSQSNVRVLKLDLMDYGRSSRVDLKLPGWGKYYPLMDLLANTKLQGLTIKGTDFFGSRTSELSRRQSSTFLRSFHHLNVINPTDESRLANILRHCPNLAELRLGSFDGESVVHSKLERAIAGLTKLKSLHLYRLDIDTRNDPHAFDDRGCWVIMPYRADSMKELVRTDFIMRHHQLEDAIQQFSTTLEVLMLEHIPEHHCLSLDLAPGHKHDHSGSITTNWSPPPAYSHSQPFSKLTHLHFEIPISKSSIDLLALVLPGLSLIHFGINGHLATLLKKVNFSTLKSLSLSDMDETLLTPFLDTILHAESHSCQINAMHFSGIKNIRRLPDLLKVVSLTRLDIVQAKRAELQAILRSLDLSKLQVLALNCDEFDWSSEEALAGRSGEFAEDLVVKLSPSPLDMKNGTYKETRTAQGSSTRLASKRVQVLSSTTMKGEHWQSIIPNGQH